MSTSTLYPPKPIRLWLTRAYLLPINSFSLLTSACRSAAPGPNSWKTAYLLEELGLNYEIKSFRFDDVKKPPFIDINPNGGVPAIEDPNTDLVLWESGAIAQYLVEQYDTEHRLSYESFQEKHLCNQWLHFQVSGQGPYYGQCGWFTYLHHEKFPSAIERYANEIRRIIGVLQGVLAAKPADKQFLVGDKQTYVDMAFVPGTTASARCWGRTGTRSGMVRLTSERGMRRWSIRMRGSDAWRCAQRPWMTRACSGTACRRALKLLLSTRPRLQRKAKITVHLH